MDHLTTAEAQGDFHFVALFHEALDLLGFEVDVVLVGFGPEADLLHQHGLLVLARLAVLLLLLVLEATVIEEAAYGWDGGRRNFDQVESTLARDLQGL